MVDCLTSSLKERNIEHGQRGIFWLIPKSSHQHWKQKNPTFFGGHNDGCSLDINFSVKGYNLEMMEDQLGIRDYEMDMGLLL